MKREHPQLYVPAMNTPSYFLCSIYAVVSKNTLVLFTLDCEAYAGIVGLILIELVVLAGQDSVQDNTGQRRLPVRTG